MKKGTYIQLASATSSDPNITTDQDERPLFRNTYSTPSAFSLNPRSYPLAGADFGKTVTFPVPLDGDLLRRVFLEVSLPSISVEPITPSSASYDYIHPVQVPLLTTYDSKPTPPPESLNVITLPLSPTAQDEWSLLLYNMLRSGLLDENLPKTYPYFASDVDNFLNGGYLDPPTFTSQSPLFRKLVQIFVASLQSYDRQSFILFIVGVFELYLNVFVSILNIVAKLMDPSRIQSVTEIVQNWNTDIFKINSTLFSTSTLVLLTQEDLLTILESIMTNTQNRLNLTPLNNGYDNPALWRDYLNDNLDESIYDGTHLQRLYEFTVQNITTLQVSETYLKNNILQKDIIGLRDAFVGETITKTKAISVFTRMLNELRQTMADIDYYTMRIILEPVVIPTSPFTRLIDVLDIYKVVQAIKKVFLSYLVRFLYFDISVTLMKEKLLEVTSNRTYRSSSDYFQLLVDNILPTIDDMVRVPPEIFVGTPTLLEHFPEVFTTYSNMNITHLLSYFLYQTIDYADSVKDYLEGKTVTLENVSKYTMAEVLNHWDLSYLLQGSKTTPSSLDSYTYIQATLGPIFLEEMYCEYVYENMPRKWFQYLQTKVATINNNYDRQVLLSYHLDPIGEIIARSNTIGNSLLSSRNTDIMFASTFDLYESLAKILSFTQYVEFTRTNESYFTYLHGVWKRKVAGDKTMWKIVSVLSDSLPATIIEDHYLKQFLTGVKYLSYPVNATPVSFSTSEPIIIVQSSSQQIQLTPGKYDFGTWVPLNSKESTYQLSFITSTNENECKLVVYPMPHFYGVPSEYTPDTIPDNLSIDRMSSIFIVPTITSIGGTYKHLSIVGSEEDALALTIGPDILYDTYTLSFKRTTQISTTCLEYEKTRQLITNDFYRINRNVHLTFDNIKYTGTTTVGNTGVVSWVEMLGIHLIKEATLICDDRDVETITPTWQVVQPCVLESRVGISKSWNHMVGYIPELTTPQTSLLPAKLCVPLGFWFSRDHHTALPLASTAYSGIRIKFRLASLSELLLYRQSKIDVKGVISFRVLCEYAYLSKPERALMVKQRHMYSSLISRTFRHVSVSESMVLGLDGPIADIFICFLPKNITRFQTSHLVDALKTMKLVLNGKEGNDLKDSKWASIVEAVGRYPGISIPHLYILPFALYPDALQPSGTLNFDAIHECRLNVTFKDGVDPSQLDMIVIYRRYVFLQVASGMIAVMFS
jgi:hypothetical protein